MYSGYIRNPIIIDVAIRKILKNVKKIRYPRDGVFTKSYVENLPIISVIVNIKRRTI